MRRCHRDWLAVTRWLLPVVAGVCLAAAEVAEDAPPAGAPKTGEVAGTIAPAAKVAAVSAVSRVTGEVYPPADWDKPTGRFVFRRLGGDARYDIRIRTTDGRDIEGIDLDFVEGRLLRLAELRRRELGLPGEPNEPFTKSDADAILRYVDEMADFMNIRRVLYVAGQGGRATMLVELMRTEAFHAQAAEEVIWRVEMWYFERSAGGWERVANQERVLRRERLSLAAWREIDVAYYPELSAYISPEGKSQEIKFDIPDKPDPSRGRPARSEVNFRTTPHVLGLDEGVGARPRAGATQPGN
jgi:hypothetical protein